MVGCCSFQFRIFTAPFQHVGFADFWLADQLNSLAVALLDLQFIICFYAHDWHVNNGECFLLNLTPLAHLWLGSVSD